MDIPWQWRYHYGHQGLIYISYHLQQHWNPYRNQASLKNEPITYLGYTSQSNEHQEPQFINIFIKAQALVRLISTSNMTRHNIHTASQSIVNSTLIHILSSTSYTYQMIDKLQRQIHSVIIVGTRCNQNWPKALRYGNHNTCTLRLKHRGTEKNDKKNWYHTQIYHLIRLFKSILKPHRQLPTSSGNYNPDSWKYTLEHTIHQNHLARQPHQRYSTPQYQLITKRQIYPDTRHI